MVGTCRQVAVSTPALYRPSCESCAGQGAPPVVPALYLVEGCVRQICAVVFCRVAQLRLVGQPDLTEAW